MQKVLAAIAFSLVLLVFTASTTEKASPVVVIPGDELFTPAEQAMITRFFNADKIRAMDSIVNRVYKWNRFYGSVLVGYRGIKLYSKTVGYADPVAGLPLTDTSAFQLASVSKQFTAVAVLKLVEKGLIRLDDPVDKYLQSFPYKGVTIRMLLNHTAGLPNYMWLLEHRVNKGSHPYNREALRLFCKAELPLYFTPGYRFHYSNTGYMVLASLVEKVSRQSFPAFMQKEFFEPLEMRHTFVYSPARPETDRESRLKGYKRWRRGYAQIKPDRNDGCVGDKNVFSTAEDLFKWDKALYEGKILSPELLTLAMEHGTIRNGRSKVPYGCGFRLKYASGKKIVYHHGLWNGFLTSFMRYVEDTSTIIVLNHTGNYAKDYLVKRLERVLFSPSKYENAEIIARIALQRGIDSAIEQYHALKANPEEQKRIAKTIDRYAKLLNSMGKTQTAFVMNLLYKEMMTATLFASREASASPNS